MNVLAFLMIARPGDKFSNGILLSTAQCMAIFCSRFLLNRLHDMTAFRLISGFGAISYILMISFPDSDLMTYIAIVLMVTSIGCWDNISALIIELRVPPDNVAAVTLFI